MSNKSGKQKVIEPQKMSSSEALGLIGRWVLMVFGAIALVALAGHFAEPYLQWMPAVRDLRDHAWWNTTAEPDPPGIVRSFYVGMLLVFLATTAAGAAMVVGALWMNLTQGGSQQWSDHA